jgi:hypothetical protein
MVFLPVLLCRKARAFRCLWFFPLTICALSGYLQAQDGLIECSDVGEAKIQWIPEPVPFSSRDEVLKQLQWTWTCLGPDERPADLNPGGRAIPAYATGRGNGTGRINYLFVHPRNPEMVWACSPTGGIWRTTNAGETWASAGTDQLPVSGASSIAVHHRKTNQWVLATGDGDDVFMFSDGLWTTSDGGITYSQINGQLDEHRLPFGQTGDMSGQISEVVTNAKSKKLFVASNRGLWVSSGAIKPASVSWRKVADGNFYCIKYIRGKNRRRDVIAAAGDKLVISYNGGSTWEEMPSPEYPDAAVFPFLRISLGHSPDDPDNLYAAVTCSENATQSPIGEAILQVFNLKEKKWKRIRSLKEGMNNVIPTRARAFAISPANKDVLMCANVQPLYRSTDGGITFSKIEKNQMHDDCHHIVFSPDGRTVWAAHDGGVSMSSDSGIHFVTRDKGIGAANVFGVSTSQTMEPRVAFGGYDTGGNVLRNGKWWHVNWGDGFETISHPTEPDILFTTMQNGGISRSTDGENFDANASPSGAKTEWHTWIRMHPVNHSTIYCAGSKLMRSEDLGDNWETILDVRKMDSTLVNAYRFFLSPDHPGVLYAYVLNKDMIHPQIWRTLNVTESDPSLIRWEKAADVPSEGWIMSIAVDPADPLRFWVLYNRAEPDGKLWYFNGKTYEDQSSNLGHSRCESMILQRGPEKRLYVGSNYGVFTRKWSESQWTLLTGLPGTYIKSLDINYTADKLVVGTFGRGVWWGDLMRK